MQYEQFFSLIKTRRSIKQFKTDPVPDEAVQKIIEAACWAPSGANSQPWEFVVVKAEQTKHKIVEIIKAHRVQGREVELTREEDLRAGFAVADREPGYKNAPVYIILCGDRRTQDAYPLLTKLLNGESTFESSLASAFLYMHLAAASLGLGSQWVSAARRPFVQCLIKDLLGIPQDLEIYDMMAVGHPAAYPKPRMVRKIGDMVHHETYDRAKYRTDEQVRSFIKALRKSR